MENRSLSPYPPTQHNEVRVAGTGVVAARRMSLASALLAGAVAAVSSTAVLMCRGRAEVSSECAPLNASSQWLWGDEALRHNRLDVKHTFLGQAIHHGSALLWGLVFEALQVRHRQPSVLNTLRDAALVTSMAALVDLKMVPDRLSPGFEKRLSPKSTAMVYGTFGVGMALAGLLVLQRRTRGA